MITGGSDWTTALNAPQKQPLYVFSIPGLAIYLCSFAPTSIITGGSALLPYLRIPRGSSQTVDELTGHSAIAELSVTAIDSTGVLKRLAANLTAIGQLATLSMGFPDLDLSDFVVIHTGRIAAIGRNDDGTMTITMTDLLMNTVSEVFLNGGPDSWTRGQAKNRFPLAPPALLDNGVPISQDNPRYLSGNPMDILLAVLQNELGIGQDDAPVFVPDTGGGSGTGSAGFAINPTWTFYDGTSNLINPNPYIDVPAILALRDGQFSGDRFEFELTSTANGKSWIEDQILKICGLYWITKSDGKLSPKSMKHPIAPASVSIDNSEIVGIPQIERWPVINMIQASIPLRANPDDSSSTGSDVLPFCFVQQASIAIYKAPYSHTISSDGLRPGLGGYQKMFLLANRIFSRHGFGTPVYTIKTFLKNFVLELGDFILLTHPVLLDMRTGDVGVTDVLCEIIERQPDYANGSVTFKVIDTRNISVPNGNFVIADDGATIPDWPAASTPQKETYAYIASSTGFMSDGTGGNQIS